MVDYTQSKTSSGSGIGFIVAAVIVVLVLLYALFAGGSVDPNADPAIVGTSETAPATETAPAADTTAPVVPATE